MKSTRLLFSMLAVGAVAAANAISFSNIGTSGTIDGVATPLGGATFANAPGINFSLSDGSSVNGVPKTIFVGFKVTADPGEDFTQFKLVPVGFLFQGKAKITVHSASGPYFQDDVYSQAGTLHLPSQTFGLALKHQYDVIAAIQLGGLDARNPRVASVTHLSFIYSEKPVPEPATLSLGLGLFALIAKKRKNRRDQQS